jgi:small subunit ribosomal protein S3
VIGKKGKDIEDLKLELRQLIKRDVAINIIEARKPDCDAQLVAEGVAHQLERRISFRRAMKDAVNRAMRAGAEGVKIIVGGRLNGADIARSEKYMEGRVPLHTLRADIEYARAEASTTYGKIGVKVWVFRGERFVKSEAPPVESLAVA